MGEIDINRENLLQFIKETDFNAYIESLRKNQTGEYLKHRFAGKVEKPDFTDIKTKIKQREKENAVFMETAKNYNNKAYGRERLFSVIEGRILGNTAFLKAAIINDLDLLNVNGLAGLIGDCNYYLKYHEGSEIPAIKQSQNAEIITGIFEAETKQIFKNNSDYAQFVNLVASYFEENEKLPKEMPAASFKLKQRTKRKAADILRTIRDALSNKDVLRNDTSFFDLIRLLDTFAGLSDNDIYKELTK